MYKLVAAILLGNGVGGRMATAPHCNMNLCTFREETKAQWRYNSTHS